MPYVTSWERDSMEKGERRLLVRQMRTRFGAECATEGEPILEQVREPEQLEQVGDWLVECSTAAELLERLRALTASPR